MKNFQEASHFLSLAHEAYLKWGAKAKAQHLVTLYPELIVTRSISDDCSVPSRPQLELNLPNDLGSYASELSF